jgi:hypothetical protein
MKKITGKLAMLFCFSLLLQACDEPENPPIDPALAKSAELLPVEVSKTASYTNEVSVSKFIYNAENRISREDIFTNNVLQKYAIYTYNVAGGLLKKTIFGANGVLLEQDEYLLNTANQPTKDSHSYPDAAGNPVLHHYVTFVYNSVGHLSQTSDFSPAGQLTRRVAYETVSDNFGKVLIYDANGRLLATNEVQYDSKKNPFLKTALNPGNFSGNVVQIATKDSLEKVVSSYTNSLNYTPEGYPSKITQTFSDGIVKTESYTYRPE